MDQLNKNVNNALIPSSSNDATTAEKKKLRANNHPALFSSRGGIPCRAHAPNFSGFFSEKKGKKNEKIRKNKRISLLTN